jgi:hypothetical protein
VGLHEAAQTLASYLRRNNVEEVEMKRILLTLLTAASLAAISAAPAAASSEPLRLSFDKSSVGPGLWQGTVDGDISGSLTTVLTDVRIAGPVWHVQFDWTISAGGSSFVAALSGTLNTETGAVVMNGTVVEGFLTGAQVHEEGQLVDAAALRFRGSIQLMPATAG